ncbi:hypothetical protein Amet_4397 [Alkaliphilus metalliredigens QYMF]|uniref:50S ribosomal protein L29 n=1 Tax=Alkaliphilus metalliredigens (strain QYMF) TaxID=293826 RepID=A6TK95_ALKMQ|nr:hypothetical protein [Alkaliphilus metalliredigens]ABR46613.1 hypothetical protein Amet_0385 [Alkaliphilus metalliredigens QYMF]ABR48087.1 hypothetical protein Amet_1923 [Alkaliphilus metalliredigens QYMF]ABR50470.1 hypothetical protein Amet_4397 [Alkaliphilus metalliredigens QYMF]
MKLTLQHIRNLNEQQWDRLKEITLLHTRLAKEHIDIFNTPGVELRKQELKRQIVALRSERDEILATAS